MGGLVLVPPSPGVLDNELLRPVRHDDTTHLMMRSSGTHTLGVHPLLVGFAKIIEGGFIGLADCFS